MPFGVARFLFVSRLPPEPMRRIRPGSLMPSLLSLLLAAATAVPLTGCQKEPEKTASPGKAQANTPATPKSISEGNDSHYREDEKILLRLATTDILELERKKAYGKIYDDYASQNFKKNVSRRDFLRMGNCLELTMGDLVDYQRDQWIFNRKADKKGIYDNTVRSVVRSSGNLKEQITYVMEGVDFKLNAIYWSSNRKDFLTCMKKVTQTMSRPSARPQTPEAATQAPPTGPAKPDTAPTAGVKLLPETKPIPPATKPTEPKSSSPVKKASPSLSTPAALKQVEPAKTEALSTPPAPAPAPAPTKPAPSPPAAPAKAPEATDAPQ